MAVNPMPTNGAENIELTVSFAATELTPEASLSYRAGVDGKVTEAFAEIGGRRHATKATADIFELAFRYRQKQASSAVLAVGDATYKDSRGDGYADSHGKTEMWRTLADHLGAAANVERQIGPQYLYDLVPEMTCEQARRQSFIATCGSTAADVHVMRGHSVLWASIPAGGPPNEIHRHMGGSVYCLFYKGKGHFHRVDPARGFETLPIEIGGENTFRMIAIPTHLWYQPRNTGTEALEYFMIHDPAFDASELLILEKEECRKEWAFEF